MAVVSFVGVMPASFVADTLGRKWTIVPSCLGLAGALLLMAFTGTHSNASLIRSDRFLEAQGCRPGLNASLTILNGPSMNSARLQASPVLH